MSESPAPRRNPAALILLFIGAALFGVGAAALILSYTKQDTTLASVPINMSMSSLLREGKPAPTFTLKTLDGKNNVALADLRGKTLLINFWASWCPPCIEETPDLAAAYKEIADPNVVFIGIGLQDENANLRKFADDNKIPPKPTRIADARAFSCKIASAFRRRERRWRVYRQDMCLVCCVCDGWEE